MANADELTLAGRIAKLEAWAHEPFDFTDLIRRLERLEQGAARLAHPSVEGAATPDELLALVERLNDRLESVYCHATQGPEWREDLLCRKAATAITELARQRDASELTISVERQKIEFRDKLIAKLEARAEKAERERDDARAAIEQITWAAMQSSTRAEAAEARADTLSAEVSQLRHALDGADIALSALDERFRELGALHTAEDAYDSFYQGIVSECLIDIRAALQPATQGGSDG